MPTSVNQVPAEVVQAELEAVLASTAFARARSLASLLNYLCEKRLRGETDQIKEYTIAVEAYGRPADFQQKEHSIVRVEIKRLRDKLRQFYETEGASHEVQILIPVGQYAPVFIERNLTADAPSDLTTEPALGVEEQTEIQSQPDELAPAPTSRESSVRRWRWVWAGLGVLLLAVALSFALWSRQPTDTGVAANAIRPNDNGSSATVLASSPETGEIRILAGSQTAKFIDRAGRVWASDRYFTGGGSIKTSMPYVERTLDPEIYQTSRQGDFRYDIPLKPGAYELRLHFAEDFYSPKTMNGGGETSRLFMVKANDEFLLRPFDIYSDAGGDRIANIRVFKDIHPAPDGLLHLHFSSWSHGKALLNAIELLSAKPGVANPIRLTAQDKTTYTADGREWLPGGYFKGGRTIPRDGTIAGTTEPELYQTERFGHFSLAIPVAPGRYTLKLYLAERFFGPNNPIPNGQGIGSRVFHVFCNGESLLKDFDIFKEAGGRDRALVRKFAGLAPDAQGKLLLEFKPIANYALIDAIEVLDEANRN